jgi:hypothetical protein
MIGLSTKCFPRDKWMQGFNKTGLKTVEINFEASEFPSKVVHARNEVKPWNTYFKTSAYSSAGKLFSDNKNLKKSQEQRLLGEVNLCKAVGARELVITLDDEIFHKRTTVNFVKRLNRRAVFSGVQLLIANNARGRFSNVVDMDFITTQAKGSGTCLNVNNLESSGHDWLEYVRPLNTKIKYVHVTCNDSVKLLRMVLEECSPKKWVVNDNSLGDAMKTLQLLTSLGVEL